MTNAEAIEQTLAELELDHVEVALVTLARTLAKAVDEDPGHSALAKEYRAAIAALREAGESAGDDDDAAFGQSVVTPMRAKVGDTPKS